MLLSKIQEEMKNSILEFILYPDETKFLRWNAIAGAGKTTTLKEMYADYKEIQDTDSSFNEVSNIRDNLVFTATTNPAVTLLNTIGCTKTSTIHKFLNLKLIRSRGNNWLKQITPPTNHKDTVVIVDEASFICPTVAKFMMMAPYRYVLIGDDQQFLAIDNKSEESIKFSNEKILETTETFRFEDPKLSSYVRVLKQNVIDRRIEAIPNQIGDSLYCISDDVYFNTLKDAYKHNSDHCLTIAFSNKQVAKYEKHIKEFLGQSDEIYTRDKLVFKSPIRNRMGFSIDKKGGKNLTEIKVLDHCVLTSVGTILDMEGIPYISITSKENSANCLLIEDMQDLNRVLRKLAKKQSWNEYYEVKDHVAVPNYGYASTSHGSQGMSIPYVFLDLTDISTMARMVGKDTIARMIYVAISRASKSIFIRGNIPQNLIGNY